MMFLLLFFINFSSSSSPAPKTSIVFTTLGRSRYQFDIYTLPISAAQSSSYNSNHHHQELKITDGVSVNFNGHFPSNSTSIFAAPSSTIQLVYITERNGVSNIYFDSVKNNLDNSLSGPKSRSALELWDTGRVQIPLLRVDPRNQGRVSMKDRPSLVGEHVIYVSTHENSGAGRASWAAVYSTNIATGSTRRLTPRGVSDFSPAVSPSGVFTAVASYGGKGWDGDVEELRTDIYVFLSRDGSERVKVVEHGGWPCWVDDRTFYFHRKDDVDGWWSVYKGILPRVGRVNTEFVVVERVTPPGLHVFTPATSPNNDEFIVVATRRPGSDYRQIELFDLKNKEFRQVTRPISPRTHHFNPFVSPDGSRVGYHKCQGRDPILLLENLANAEPEISLFRIDGSFPSFSPTGDRIAYLENLDSGFLYVVDHDGSNKKLVHKGAAFTTAWDPIRKGVVYTSVGPNFASERTKVDIISIDVEDQELSYKKLTYGGENNAFPSPSPDGKWIVFRSGRSGHKNLYIMDAEKGEMGSIQRLTKGPWSDTMCNWSPDGEWIAFASDRDNPGGGSFQVFMIRPNGTGLHKVIQSGSGGRANHPWFSPDGKRIVFTSDYAGVSAEPISNPHHYQPYGEIFIANVDGSDIRRLTHNSYEDGTPTWGPMFISPENIAQPTIQPKCMFDDCHWLNILGVNSVNASSIGAQC
ncbi:Tol-Pal system protein TolB 2 [Bienertia sinuspersici]